MPWTPDNLSVKGAKRSFDQAMEAGPTIWDKHCRTYPSETDTEALTFPGFLPAPREFLDSRQFQGARDFRYNVQNKEYELSMLVTRKAWEDDQTGGVNIRFAETAEVWRTFKDAQFAALLAAGNVAGSLGFDGTVFHSDTHTAIGGSGAFDNILGTNIAATTPFATTTVAEAQTSITAARKAFWTFNDDQGRPYNSQAIVNMRAIIPPNHEDSYAVAIGAGVISQTDNVFTPKILQGIDVLPYLTTAGEVYYSCLGSERKPFLMQERTGLEVVILADGDSVALNNGVMLLCRQRYVMTYGDPRRSILDIFA